MSYASGSPSLGRPAHYWRSRDHAAESPRVREWQSRESSPGAAGDGMLNIPPAHAPRRPCARGSPLLPVSCVPSGRRHALSKHGDPPRTANSPEVSADSFQPLDLTVKKDGGGLAMKQEPCEPEGAALCLDEPMDLSVNHRPLDLSRKPAIDDSPVNGGHHQARFTSGGQQSFLKRANFDNIKTEPSEAGVEIKPVKQKKRKRKRKSPESPCPTKDIKSPKLAILVDSNGDEIFRMSQSPCNKTEAAAASNINIPAPASPVTMVTAVTTPVKLKSLLTGAIVTQTDPSPAKASSPAGETTTDDRRSSVERTSPVPAKHKTPTFEPRAEEEEGSEPRVQGESQSRPTAEIHEVCGVIKAEELEQLPSQELSLLPPRDTSSASPVSLVTRNTSASPVNSDAPISMVTTNIPVPLVTSNIPTTVHEISEEGGDQIKSKKNSSKGENSKRKSRKSKEPKSSKSLRNDPSKEDGAVKKAPFILRSPVYNGKLVDIKPEPRSLIPDTLVPPPGTLTADKSKSVIKSMLESRSLLNHSKSPGSHGNSGINSKKGSVRPGHSDQGDLPNPGGFTGSKLFSLLTGHVTNAVADYSADNYSGDMHTERCASDSEAPANTRKDKSAASPLCSNEDGISVNRVSNKSDPSPPPPPPPKLTDKKRKLNNKVKKEVSAGGKDGGENGIDTVNRCHGDQGENVTGTCEAGSPREDSPHMRSPTSYRSLLSGKVVKQCDVSDGVMVVARGQVTGETRSRYELVVDFQPEVVRGVVPLAPPPSKTALHKNAGKGKSSGGKKKPKTNKLEQICQSLWMKSKENTI